MNGKLIGLGMIGALIISLIIVVIFVNPIDVSPPKKESDFKNWHKSGPFAINKQEYRIGENIFLAVEGLLPNDIGNIVFILPNGTTKYISVPFDATQKSSFNYYFKPSVAKARNICSTDDIIGDWMIIFQGTQYKPLEFRILNDTISSEQGNFQRVC